MKKIIVSILCAAEMLFISMPAAANELVITQQQAHDQGFVTLPQRRTWLMASLRSAHDPAVKLQWPFEQPYSRSRMGNNFVQYQPYGPAGYHMGCDMLVEANSWVVAPIEGRLEAGHYAYTDLPNGDRIKHWKPWPQSGDDTYFELAVIDVEGTRFELHHVNPYSLPDEVVNGLNAGGYHVMQGQRLGRVVDWPTPFHYNHFHVNIFDAKGVSLNPENYFELIPDHIAPDVHFYAVDEDGHAVVLQEGAILPSNTKALAIFGADAKDNSVYVQAPEVLSLFQNGVLVRSHDFRQSLLTENGFSDIRELYPESLPLREGGRLSQPYGFYPVDGTRFIMRISTQGLAAGNFELRVSDFAGNTTSFHGRL